MTRVVSFPAVTRSVAASGAPVTLTFTQLRLNGQSSVAPLNALTLPSNTIAENTGPGVVIGTVQGITGGSTVTLTSNAGGRVALSGADIVTTSTPFDYETATSHTISIRETLAGAPNSPRDSTLTINVTDVNETAPVSLNALSLPSNTIAENTGPGVVIGTVQGFTGGSTIELIDNAGGRVALSGADLVTTSTPFDYETATSHTVTIRETLAGATNSPRTSTLTINVTDVAEGPSYGPELVTNGGFDSDTAWSDRQANWSVSGGRLVSAGAGEVHQNLGLVSGKTYRLIYTIVTHTGGAALIPRVGGTNGPGATTPATYTLNLTAGADPRLSFIANDFYGTVDNVSVREVL